MLDWQPKLPHKLDYGIALVGCGSIVHDGTLPTYRKYGLNVVGCYDLNRDTAEATAREYNIPTTYRDLDELLSDKQVAIVEIAVPPWEQFQIAAKCMLAGKHLLCQKPLSDDLAQAYGLVARAKLCNVKLAVNQQLRWGPSVRVASYLLKKGYVGKLTDVTFAVSVYTDWSAWSWLPSQPRLEVMYHSIHYIDTLRALFGEPTMVACGLSHHDPTVKGESGSLIMLYYPEFRAIICDNHYNLAGEPRAGFAITGHEGEITGTLGTMLNYPYGENDEIHCRCKHGDFHGKLTGKWIPDAFIGPISSLMRAIQEDGAPETSGADHLKTLEIVEACYEAHEKGRVIKL